MISGWVLVIAFCPKIIGFPRTGVVWWVLGLGKPCYAILYRYLTVLVFGNLHHTCSRKQIPKGRDSQKMC